jgi:hypothetical protein
MNTLELLKKAIKIGKPIRYEYNREDCVIGIRYGNPHAIYIHPETKNLNIDIFKTNGVYTKIKPPSWNIYIINYISNVEIFEEKPEFENAPKYKPNSERYKKAIIKR